MTLLKKKTNFDKLKTSSLSEMACMLTCPYDKDFETDDFCKGKNCIDCTKQWLMQGVKE